MCLRLFKHSSRSANNSPFSDWDEKEEERAYQQSHNLQPPPSNMFSKKSKTPSTDGNNNYASYEAIKDPSNYQGDRTSQSQQQHSSNESRMRSDSQQFNRRGVSGTAGSNYDSKVRDVIDDYFDNPAAFFKNATELLATPGLNAVHFANLNIWLGYHNNKQSFFRFRQALESCNTEIRLALEHHSEIAPDVMKVREQAIEALKAEKPFMDRQQQLCEENWASRGKLSRHGSRLSHDD